MIIPVRCMTCGKVIADKWVAYVRRVEELKERGELGKDEKTEDVMHADEARQPRGRVLDDLGIVRMCCRRHMLSHTDLIDLV